MSPVTAIRDLPVPTLLWRLAALEEDRSKIDAEIEELVQAARQAGTTWKEIGAAYGVTKQAAQQRFGRHVRRALGSDNRA